MLAGSSCYKAELQLTSRRQTRIGRYLGYGQPDHTPPEAEQGPQHVTFAPPRIMVFELPDEIRGLGVPWAEDDVDWDIVAADLGDLFGVDARYSENSYISLDKAIDAIESRAPSAAAPSGRATGRCCAST